MQLINSQVLQDLVHLLGLQEVQSVKNEEN